MIMCIANSRPLTFFFSFKRQASQHFNDFDEHFVYFLLMRLYLLKCYWLDFLDNAWVTDMNEIIVFLFILSMSPYIPVALHV